MRIHRVYKPHLQQGRQQLYGAEAHHLIRVLRVKPGQALKLFDGQGLEASATVASVEEDRLWLELAEPAASQVEAPWHITLAVALPKGDKMTDIIRQATELGVSRVIPLKTEHGDVPILKDNKLERFRKVAREAAKQSGRSLVPEVTALDSLDKLPSADVRLVAHPYRSQVLADIVLPEDGASILCVTGPEGGLSAAEVEALEAQGFSAVSFGPRILRAETAAIALLAALLLPRGL